MSTKGQILTLCYFFYELAFLITFVRPSEGRLGGPRTRQSTVPRVIEKITFIVDKYIIIILWIKVVLNNGESRDKDCQHRLLQNLGDVFVIDMT